MMESEGEVRLGMVQLELVLMRFVLWLQTAIASLSVPISGIVQKATGGNKGKLISGKQAQHIKGKWVLTVVLTLH